MRIKMPAVRIAQDSDLTDVDVTVQDILTCGSCQKPFALSDIVKFIQHKILNCNKENFGHCSEQGPKHDNDSEDVRQISLISRRPSITAPISNQKTSSSRDHTPPPSPAELLADGASSTPKRLVDENDNKTPNNENLSQVHRLTSGISKLDAFLEENFDKTKANVIKNKIEYSADINISICNKSNNEQPKSKRRKVEVVDAESNTLQTVQEEIHTKAKSHHDRLSCHINAEALLLATTEPIRRLKRQKSCDLWA
ncbi:uncharacterized protein LOC119662221 [Teleopsis dalmanni]|uniref:uncharacterized protein LOC119662221 n=1 Tax=Teleopsis dalmanni TaxID=139649 RepID=UPI0018CCA906|nr:uncharacterized protein LOC119662221 [Teleopsis dalmanni]